MALIVVFAAALGLSVGSFLTVVVHRLPTGVPMGRDRSRCPFCKKILSWYELVPVLSFLAQGGHCRSCRALIPWHYLAIELTCGIAFAVLAWEVLSGAIPKPAFVGFFDSSTTFAITTATFCYYAVFMTLAIAIAVYDFVHRLIVTSFTRALVGLGFLAGIAGTVASGTVHDFGWSLAVSFAAFAFFWSLWFFSGGRAMGRGDADLAFAFSISLPAPVAAVGFVGAFVLGAVFGILAIVAGRLNLKSQVPFAPFLVSGALLSLFLTETALSPLHRIYGP